MDIIAANATSDVQGGVQVWLGDGKGNWPLESGPTICGVYMDVLAVDLNHDGLLDLIGAGWGSGLCAAQRVGGYQPYKSAYQAAV